MLGSEFRYLADDSRFVCSILLHDRNEIGNEVISILEDGIDRRKSIVDRVLRSNDAVVCHDKIQYDNCKDPPDSDKCRRHVPELSECRNKSFAGHKKTVRI